MKIKEIIVVEGRDDTAAINRAVEAETIETHGFGMSEKMWKEVEKAAETRGIIVFTDPDHAGEKIRRKIKERFPDCKEAFLPRTEALKNGDIGVENAAPEAIREALSKARFTEAESCGDFTPEDMEAAGLMGGRGSRRRRELVADALGIGYGNVKAMLSKLNSYGVSREEFYEIIRSIDDPCNQK
jgi:ribonuclease M5